MAGEDGRLEIDTRINTKGIEDGVENINSQVASLAAEFRKSGDDQSTAMKKAWAEIREESSKLGESFKEIGQSSSIFSDTLKANLTGQAIVGGIQAIADGIETIGDNVLNAGIGFESAFAGVEKTVDGTTQQMDALRTGIRDMAKEIPATAENIAGVAEAAGQLGIKTENVLVFTRVMVDLGESTNMSADMAATSLARLANITQMPQENFDRLGSTVVALGNNLATTESEIVSLGLRLAGAGKQVGLTEAQILSFGGALSSLGIEAEAGGSAFSKVMLDIDMAAAKGGEAIEAYAEVAGMSASQFAKAWKDDAAGALVSFVEGLGRIKEEGGNVADVLAELGFSEIRVRDALLRASGAGDTLRNALELGNQAWEDNNALTNEAAKRYETTASQLQIARNTLHDIGIEIGTSVLPAVKDLTVGFVDLVAKNQDKLVAFGTAIADGLGFIVDNADFVVAGIAAIGVGLSAATISAVSAGGAMTGLAASITAVGLAITSVPVVGWIAGISAAVVGVGVVAWNRYRDAQEEAREEMLNTGDTLLELSQKVSDIGSMANTTEELIKSWRNLDEQLQSANLTAEKRKDLESELKNTGESLISASDGLITRYDLENGLISDKIPLLEKQLDMLKKIADAEYEAAMGAFDPTEQQKALDDLIKKRDELEASIKREQEAYLLVLGASEEYNKAIKETEAGSEEQIAALEELNDKLVSSSEHNINLTAVLSDGEKVKELVNKSWHDMQDELDSVNGDISKLSGNLDTHNDLLNGTREQTAAAAGKMHDFGTESNRAANAIAETKKQQEELTKKINEASKETNSLEQAYQKLAKGEELSNDQLRQMILQYPEVADHIAQTNDVTLDGGRIIREVDAIRRAALIATLEGEKARLTTLINSAKESIEATKGEMLGRTLAMEQFYKAQGALSEMSAEEMAEHEAALKSVETQIKALSLITLDNIDASTAAADRRKSASEAEKEAIKLEEQAYKDKVDTVNQVADDIIKALENQYKEEYELLTESIDDQIEAVKNGTDSIIEDYDRRHKEVMGALDAETKAELKAYQDQIDAIKERQQEENRVLKEEQDARKLADLQDAVRRAETDEAKKTAQKRLADELASQEREAKRRADDEEIESLKNQQRAVEEEAKAKKEKEIEDYKAGRAALQEEMIAQLDTEKNIVKKNYEEMISAEKIQSEARLLMIKGDNDKIIELLDTYNPDWKQKGNEFGENLLKGLQEETPKIQAKVNEILDIVRSANISVDTSSLVNWSSTAARMQQGTNSADTAGISASSFARTAGAAIQTQQAAMIGSLASTYSTSNYSNVNTRSTAVNNYYASIDAKSIKDITDIVDMFSGLEGDTRQQWGM